MKRVVIVNKGSWGGTDKGSYASWIRALIRTIKGFERVNEFTRSREKMAEVQVVDSLEEAVEKKPDLLIFISRGIIDEAKGLNKIYPQILMILFTGLPPKEELIILQKTWLNPDLMHDILDL